MRAMRISYIEITTKGVWEPRIIFNHMACQNYEGVSIFWLRRTAALDGEESAIEHWQIKCDGKKRGIVEVLKDDT